MRIIPVNSTQNIQLYAGKRLGLELNYTHLRQRI